jgi:hypothetical protein
MLAGRQPLNHSQRFADDGDFGYRGSQCGTNFFRETSPPSCTFRRALLRLPTRIWKASEPAMSLAALHPKQHLACRARKTRALAALEQSLLSSTLRYHDFLWEPLARVNTQLTQTRVTCLEPYPFCIRRPHSAATPYARAALHMFIRMSHRSS